MAGNTSVDDGFLDFTTSVYDALDRKGNVCVSPYSLINALLLLMIGTRGRTKDQISSAVFTKNKTTDDDHNFQKFKDLNEKLLSGMTTGLQLNVASKLFVNDKYTLKRYVSSRAERYFNAEIGYKDFTKPKVSAIFMNRFVAKHTNDKIKDLINPDWLDSMTVMVLINAVYFKGEWKTKFDATNTRKEDFSVNRSRTIKVDMMKNELAINYMEDEDLTAIALPYQGGQFDMVFILPKTVDGLSALEKKISSKLLKNIHSRFYMMPVKVAIPKFTFETEVDLKKVFPNMGISDAFSPSKADFSNLIKQKTGNIYVSKAVHKVFLEVNEEGTEATAATVIVTRFRSARRSKQFIADHPFLFYIRHISTDIVLFMGRYSPS